MGSAYGEGYNEDMLEMATIVRPRG
jgi:hypothetical protein